MNPELALTKTDYNEVDSLFQQGISFLAVFASPSADSELQLWISIRELLMNRMINQPFSTIGVLPVTTLPRCMFQLA